MNNSSFKAVRWRVALDQPALFFSQAAEHNQRCLWIHHLQHLWPMFSVPNGPLWHTEGQAEIAPLVVEIPSSAPFALVALQTHWTDSNQKIYVWLCTVWYKIEYCIFGGVVPHFFVKNVQAHVLTFWLIPQCFQLLSATSRVRASQATEVLQRGALWENRGPIGLTSDHFLYSLHFPTLSTSQYSLHLPDLFTSVLFHFPTLFAARLSSGSFGSIDF